MSYELDLHFDPVITRPEFLKYFESRGNYTIAQKRLTYQNADTGAGLAIEFAPRSGLFSGNTVAKAHIEINYFRPSYFGLEAELELAALCARFPASVDDPQMQGMGQGPYTGEKFLRGWNFGNAFAVKTILERNPNHVVKVMPAATLQSAWAWNLQRAKRLAAAADEQFVPLIMPVEVQGTARLVAVWGAGMPILLPAVEFVMLGRDDGGQKRYGLAPWSAVRDLAHGCGFEESNGTIDLRYSTTPVAIARWFAEFPEVDVRTLPRLSFTDIIDSELVSAARSRL